jgi:hypothetical protein
MQKSSDGSNSFDEARSGSPRTGEPVIGDADNVQKTTGVVGRGTDPDAPDPAVASARVPAGGGINMGAWIVAVIAALIAVIYASGIFTS